MTASRLKVSRILYDLECRGFHGSETREAILGFVPGRIELLGKHTDYAGGHSLVCAVDRGFLFLATRTDTPLVRMIQPGTEFLPAQFPLSADIEPPLGRWENYPMTMTQRLAANFGWRGTDPVGVDIAFASDLPVGSGMSGSSALMMLTFCALSWAKGLQEATLFKANIATGEDLAMYLACAENGQSFRDLAGQTGVGTFGGSEDHTAILNCRDGSLSYYSYAPTVLAEELSWPEDWALLIGFSGVRAEKTKSAREKFNAASRRAVRAVESFNEARSTHHSLLRDLPQTAAFADSEIEDRVRQFFEEETRYMPAAIAALRGHDVGGFGEQLNLSHRASARLLGNVAPQVDALQKSALSLGAAGATCFGAGFGGSLYAVTAAERAEEIGRAWQALYASTHPEESREASFFRTRPSSGIRLWNGAESHRLVDELFDAGS